MRDDFFNAKISLADNLSVETDVDFGVGDGSLGNAGISGAWSPRDLLLLMDGLTLGAYGGGGAASSRFLLSSVP